MTNRISEKSPLFYSRVAGFGLLLMFILAIFANFFVLEGLIVPGDAATTANNIIANESLFRSGIISFIIVLILDESCNAGGVVKVDIHRYFWNRLI